MDLLTLYVDHLSQNVRDNWHMPGEFDLQL